MKKSILFVIAALICFAMTDFVFARSPDVQNSAAAAKRDSHAAPDFHAQDAQNIQSHAATPGIVRAPPPRISAIRNDWFICRGQSICLGYRGESSVNRIRAEPQ